MKRRTVLLVQCLVGLWVNSGCSFISDSHNNDVFVPTAHTVQLKRTSNLHQRKLNKCLRFVFCVCFVLYRIDDVFVRSLAICRYKAVILLKPVFSTRALVHLLFVFPMWKRDYIHHKQAICFFCLRASALHLLTGFPDFHWLQKWSQSDNTSNPTCGIQ